MNYGPFKHSKLFNMWVPLVLMLSLLKFLPYLPEFNDICNLCSFLSITLPLHSWVVFLSWSLFKFRVSPHPTPFFKLCSLGILLNFFILSFFTYRDNSSTNLIGLLWSQTWHKGSFDYNSKEQWEQTFIFLVLAEEANIWKMGPQNMHMHNKIHKTLPGQKNYQNTKMQLYTMNS